ncbi:MAG: hypothetical protein M3O46_18635 [Myxococcota bacterium]|nr:hypothetical protein [Myxococcota bacterium]
MRAEATLSQDEAAELVRKFVPFELELGEPGKSERFVAVDDVSDVRLVADAGVRVTCQAHLRWPVLGLHVPVHVKTLQVLLRPSIEPRNGRRAFVFAFTIEHADIAWSPTIVDESITQRVNRELAEHHVELSWDFTQTLSHVFRLPEAMRTAETFELDVVGGEIRVTEQSLAMMVDFRASVGRREI